MASRTRQVILQTDYQRGLSSILTTPPTPTP